MKIAKIVIILGLAVLVLALIYIGVRLVPGFVVFSLVRDLATELGLDSQIGLAIALLLAMVPPAYFIWRGFSWQRLVTMSYVLMLTAVTCLALKGFLQNRVGEVRNPEATRWFGVDGRALLFYTRGPEGLRFSDRPGFDVRIGQRLLPVTPEIRKEWEEHRTQSNKADEAKALQEGEAERAQADLLRRLEATEAKLRLESKARVEVENTLQELKRNSSETEKHLMSQLLLTHEELRLQKEVRLKSDGESRNVLQNESAAEKLRSSLENQLRVVEARLQQENQSRVKLENELQTEVKKVRELKDQVNSYKLAYASQSSTASPRAAAHNHQSRTTVYYSPSATTTYYHHQSRQQVYQATSSGGARQVVEVYLNNH